MSNTKHTPKQQWTVDETTRTLENVNTNTKTEVPEYWIKETHGLPVARVHLGLGRETAALIAAAPDLLELVAELKYCLTNCYASLNMSESQSTKLFMERINATIAKATGGAE